jgi:hypothetical protein
MFQSPKFVSVAAAFRLATWSRYAMLKIGFFID